MSFLGSLRATTLSLLTVTFALSGCVAAAEAPADDEEQVDEWSGLLAAGDVAVVRGSNLNLRQGPGTEHAVVTVIPEGSRVRVTGAPVGSWAPVKWETYQGFAHTNYLTVEAAGDVHLDVPWVLQNPELPRGCEVTSLAMLLKKAGVNADKMRLASQIDKVPYWVSNGVHGNPYDGFVGNMYTFSEKGFGAYHKPVKRLAERYLPGKIVDLTGKSFDDLLVHVRDGRPVWIISHSRFRRLDDASFETWQTTSGPIKITWHEHSVVITGYDANFVYINDPLDPNNGRNKRLARSDFKAAWEQMGRQAITYRR